MFGQTLRFIVSDLILNVLYFPVWWYTTGALRVLRLIGRELQSFTESFRLRTLFQFLWQPMFGLTDPWSRVISVGVRLGHFFVLSLFTLVYTIMLFALFLVWLLLPAFIVYNVLFHLEIIEGIELVV